jgi:hypothetical protein
VAAFLDTGGVDAVITRLFGVDGVTDSPDLVKHLDARFLERFDGLRADALIQGRSRNLDSGDLLLGADLYVHLVVLRRYPHGREDGDADKEGFIGQLSGFLNGVSEVVLGVPVAGGDVSNSAGVADGGTELGRTQPHHRTADDGVLDAEHFGNSGLEHVFLLRWFVSDFYPF